MRRNTALVLSGLLTAFAMVLVIGIVSLAGRFSQTAQAAPAGITAADPKSTTDVPTLQAMVATYRNALQKSNQDLQAAYNQIQALDNQVQQLSSQNAQDGQGGFQNGGFEGSGRRRFRNGDDSGGNFNLFGGGPDD